MRIFLQDKESYVNVIIDQCCRPITKCIILNFEILKNALRKKPTTFPFCPREEEEEEEEEETQVEPKFLFTWQYPPPLQ